MDMGCGFGKAAGFGGDMLYVAGEFRILDEVGAKLERLMGKIVKYVAMEDQGFPMRLLPGARDPVVCISGSIRGMGIIVGGWRGQPR